MRTMVFTCDPYYWLLPGFFHQWERYDNRPIEVVGFGMPTAAQRAGHPFVSLGEFKDYPKDRWSDALIDYLESIDDDLVEFWLEDYWLIRQTNVNLVYLVSQFMMANPQAFRFDLITDRLYAPGVQDAGSMGPMDIVTAKGQYSLSYQASVFRRELLLEILQPNESPWASELEGTARLNASPYGVYGSRQSPVRYSIVVNKGQFDREGAWMFPPRTLSARDWAELDRLGYTQR